ncbi:hypothetical protein HanHA89_Chr16g0666631 [Helianthus annuus]|nr:hypothetical protein HanHA89_Chr16g0666631 [Helianthus annuus]
MKGDSFTVDMEPFSHLSNKDLTLSSRIIRSPSRKECQMETDRKMNSKCVMDDGDTIHSNKGSSSISFYCCYLIDFFFFALSIIIPVTCKY